MTSSDVRKIRERLGLSRKEFAAVLGASVRTIEAWETSLKPSRLAANAMKNLEKLETAKR